MLEFMIVLVAAILLWVAALPTIRAEREEKKMMCGYCGTSSDPNDICKSCFPVAEEPGGTMTAMGDPIYDNMDEEIW